MFFNTLFQRTNAVANHRLLLERIDLIRKITKDYQQTINFEMILWLNYSKFLTENSTIIDIGAHTGLHLSNFSTIANNGVLLAFEPLPFAYKTLVKKFKKSKNVKIFNIALSNYAGKSNFTFAKHTPEESGLKVKEVYSRPDLVTLRTISVPVNILDNFTEKLKKIDYIKIDIEGGEIDCLHGSTRTINTFRPIISCEYISAGYKAYHYNRDTLYLWAIKHNYVLFDIFGYKLLNLKDWRMAVDSVYWDFFLVPKEKESFFSTKINT